MVKYSGAMYNDSGCNMVCISNRYDIKMLSTSQEWREYDNLFDKLADLSDTSRADDFYKQSPKIKHGKDLDIL